jgi:hypothetical protein
VRSARATASLFLGLALVALFCLAGCLPQQASYDFGISTSQIVGDLEVEDPDTAGPPLVFVYKYHYLFVNESSDDPVPHTPSTVARATASLAPVLSDGSFSISVPTDVVRLEVFFISPDRLTDIFQFQKQVGIGRVVYHARLKRMPDWRSHFYTYLKPELENVIVDSRYELPPQDQAQLAAWLTQQQTRLEALRKPKPST